MDSVEDLYKRVTGALPTMLVDTKRMESKFAGLSLNELVIHPKPIELKLTNVRIQVTGLRNKHREVVQAANAYSRHILPDRTRDIWGKVIDYGLDINPMSCMFNFIYTEFERLIPAVSYEGLQELQRD